MKEYLKARPWFVAHEGDGDGDAATAAAEAKAAADKAAADKAAADAATKAAADAKKFSQEEVNRLLQEDRKKHEKRVQEVVTQLEETKKAKGLSEQEKSELQTRIDEMKSSLLTSEERAKQELKKKDAEYKTQLEQTSKEKEAWRTLFSDEATTNQILRATAKHKALSDEQIGAFLLPKTRLVEVLDDDGKSTGKWTPKVKFPDEKDGKPIELDLTIDEAVKRMKDLPERFGNLFDGGTSGGLGGLNGKGGSGGGGGSLDSETPPKDPVQYRVWRKKRLGRAKV